MPMGFTGELTIATQVSDLDTALAWYHEMLGSEVLYKVAEMGWAEVTSPVARTAIGLSQVEKPKTTGCVPVWAVADIDAARRGRLPKSVRFDGDMTIPGRRSDWQPSSTPTATPGCSRRA